LRAFCNCSHNSHHKVKSNGRDISSYWLSRHFQLLVVDHLGGKRERACGVCLVSRAASLAGIASVITSAEGRRRTLWPVRDWAVMKHPFRPLGLVSPYDSSI
jgi:hypothetical protein